MKSEMNNLFLIQLKADWCVILFTAEAIEHILKLKKNCKKKNKQKKINQKSRRCIKSCTCAHSEKNFKIKNKQSALLKL